MAENKQKIDDDFVTLKKKFNNPDKVVPVHANEATLSHTNNEFFLTFYRIEPPIVLDDSDRKAIREGNEIEAIAVTKVVLSPSFAKAVADIFQNQLNKFEITQDEDK